MSDKRDGRKHGKLRLIASIFGSSILQIYLSSMMLAIGLKIDGMLGGFLIGMGLGNALANTAYFITTELRESIRSSLINKR